MHRTEGLNNDANLFQNGPPGTRIEEDWLNAVQEELCNVILEAGIVLKSATSETRDQLKLGILALINLRLPANVIAYTTDVIVPAGWSEYTNARGRMIVGLPLAGTNEGAIGVALTDQQDKTHTHTGPSHTHTGPSHTHTGPSHTHTGPSHTHTGPSHNHKWLDTTQDVATPDYTYDAAGNPEIVQKGAAKTVPGGVQGIYPVVADQFTSLLDGYTNLAGTGATGADGTGATGADGTGSTGADGTGATGADGTGATGTSALSDFIAYIQLKCIKKD